MSSESGGDCFSRSEEFLSRVTAVIRGPIALAYSYQAEDTVALDMLLKLGLRELSVFTLDTKKLFPELADYHRQVEDFFAVNIERLCPDEDEERELDIRQGEFGMRESLADRQLCCRIRKVKPLMFFLEGKSAWITGLRASQSVTRSGMRELEYDSQFKLIKINPLVDWSWEDVERYLSEKSLPRNPLYEKGFKSIGCAPCTRPVKAGEDIRAGRWWWENPENRECGCMKKNGRDDERRDGGWRVSTVNSGWVKLE
jgi:phosphoadenosine phosphosulfate reductase